MKRIFFAALLIAAAIIFTACGDKSVYALSGSAQLQSNEGAIVDCDFSGCTVTVESVKVWPQKTAYENSDWSCEISLMVNMTLRVPESWTDEQRFVLMSNLHITAFYKDGSGAIAYCSKHAAPDTNVINITMAGIKIAGDEISFTLSANGEKIKGGEFKRRLN